MSKEGVIFSIEEFAVNDGPGIRSTIFLKGCPLRCAWCHNPEGISPYPQYMVKKSGRKMCGYVVSSDELAKQVLKNKEIYKLNHGGITLTGGEPLFQADFVVDFLGQVRPDVHTAIETSGYAVSKTFQKVISEIDLVLFDVKLVDAKMHKRYTGVDNKCILDNLAYLCGSGKEFIIRIPLIPGVNDTKANMLATLEHIKGAKNLKRVELLRYNKLAGAKYPMIGKEYKPPFDATMPPAIHDVFSGYGIPTLIL